MGFLDKIKNMFTEEVEDDDVKVEQVKSEVTHVAIESPNATKDDFEDKAVNNFEFRTEEKVMKPVFFDDSDFKDLNLVEDTKKDDKPKTREKEFYNISPETKEKEEKKVFKPTPIISPVYGILDKNYHKEDIVSKRDTESNFSSSDPSIDSVRNKAYGTLEDELENTLFGTNSILFKDEEPKEDSALTEISEDKLSNLTDDISKELDELLIKKEKYSDEELKKNIKNDENLDEEDLLGFIDSTLYKDGDEN